ncbi:protein NUCLEAR FUSION DEFECTIVE 4 [Amborella trichopoda]|uniref:protein NUCLEAR FUSION DEFECTIVE 4 n=1 Tax=Amborella trichopoda TaxID=13333 RepID=UPI0005D38453|nr:protein NUCLEAR FUSION DEFECTIVE 4 [Amborella trichopoda]|eukprot:XP_011626992.1 protein NUCLEAR FUSION DEFECTIVE 4 [Amborella trichopoda]
MAGQSRKWTILVATIWIQAFTGTNFDFSAYSSSLKSVLGISQVQLNYLAVASDLGKALAWSSGFALLHLPVPTVLLIAAIMGLAGYGAQWLVIRSFISLPYFVVFLLCLLAGNSICWFNTVSFVLCIRNFPVNRPIALALTISYNGVSAAIYHLAARSITLSSSGSVYLLLNAIAPLFASIAALPPILRQPEPRPLDQEAANRDAVVFLFLNILAIVIGIYLLSMDSLKFTSLDIYRALFAGAIIFMILPLCIPGIIYARDWAKRTIHSSFRLEGPGFNLIDNDDLDLTKELLVHEKEKGDHGDGFELEEQDGNYLFSRIRGYFGQLWSYILGVDKLAYLGDEHNVSRLVRRVDFWLYFMGYFCGGTVGLVYSNNMGQILQSVGGTSGASSIVSLYSSFSFFGRLLSAWPDYSRGWMSFARTGSLAMALVPTPIAFFILIASGSTARMVYISTALIALSSGFIFAATVSVTAELFGPNAFGVNHNILITNIPIGSLVYGSIAALIYDLNGRENDGAIVCMGAACYRTTFVWWGCLSVVGLVCNFLLFLRTKGIYNHYRRITRG